MKKLNSMLKPAYLPVFFMSFGSWRREQIRTATYKSGSWFMGQYLRLDVKNLQLEREEVHIQVK